MHINHDDLILATESDVEQKVILPLLTGPQYLAIPLSAVRTKEYLKPSHIDKAAGKTVGYYPDYSVWFSGFPVLVVEAKAPDVAVEVGYREASLYARHLNQQYPTGINPCTCVLATNGKSVAFGFWDSNPIIEVRVADLRPESIDLLELRRACDGMVLLDHSKACLQQIRRSAPTMPYMLVGGPALLNAKLPANSFAAELSPILRRYFLSRSQENLEEILERAYVTSDEITEYDKILESLLRDRIAVRRGTIVQPLRPDKHGEDHVREAIEEFGRTRPEGGQLQIVQGAVGSGKSLFIQRYRAIQSRVVGETSRWAFVDFNTSPADLSQGENWVASAFVESFEAYNPGIDLTAPEVLRGMFSRNLQRKRVYYAALPADQVELERAKDLTTWLDEPLQAARGIAEYVLGSRREILVVVMDNVDRLDLKSQLQAFQLTLWFMQQTKAFVILQMRDETYERYKDRPPLDTFRTGITFHVSPPRFIDVVKRRLELSLEYLARSSPKTQSYVSDTGFRIAYARDELSEFIALLYSELFDRKRNVSRLLEAIAGWDVRRALDMFVSIIVSGHLNEPLVTSRLIGGQNSGKPLFSEHLILQIIMRTEYRFFSEHSGFVSNIFEANPEWEKPDNFLLTEILYYLALNKKKVGELGLQGYFTCRFIMQELQRLGYVDVDILDALNRLLQRRLIGADHMNFSEVKPDDSVRIHASGFMHVRVLVGRLEYLYGIIPTTAIFERDAAERVAEYIRQESIRTHIAAFQKAKAVEIFCDYLARQRTMNKTPFNENNGADYVLRHAKAAIQRFYNERSQESAADPLDV